MSTQPYAPAQMHAFNERLIAEFRANDGQVGGMFAGIPLLLLTTVGAKSGEPRIAPLTYGADGSRLVVIAAKRGAPTNPDWYHNLVAHPEVTVEVEDEAFSARARVAMGAERQRLFDQMAAQTPNFAEYQRAVDRQLPVIVLERILDNTTDYNAFNRGFIAEFRANGGKVGGMFEGLPLLLLTTTGARTGQPRVAPLVYDRDDDRLVIIASKGGSPTNPDWYHNIVANPDVSVDLGTETFPARATIAEGAERERLFDRLVAAIPKLKESQESTPRQLPIIVLERAS